MGFLALAKAKNALQGYSAPKPFSLSDTDRCVGYDLRVVDEWLGYLAAYQGSEPNLSGKTVLELGPGSDLGIGVYLLARGAAAYCACDIHDLALRAPASFYTALLNRINARVPAADMSLLDSQVQRARTGTASRLRLVVREDFDLTAAFGADSIDLVLSQAAFEHFDDVERTVAGLSVICKSGAMIAAVIDLKTHSRWIRDKDPNNIYRYSDRLYGKFRYRGIPNRMRPYQYKEIFERHGWINTAVTALEMIPDRLREGRSVNARFKDERSQLECLSVVLCATKA
jgi:hypothetical protein